MRGGARLSSKQRREKQWERERRRQRAAKPRLACELEVVREVVDELVVAEPDVVLGIEDMLDAVW